VKAGRNNARRIKMGYYETKRKIAKELQEACQRRPVMTETEVKRLKAQMVAGYGISMKTATELVEANIDMGSLNVLPDNAASQPEQKGKKKEAIPTEEEAEVDKILKASVKP